MFDFDFRVIIKVSNFWPAVYIFFFILRLKEKDCIQIVLYKWHKQLCDHSLRRENETGLSSMKECLSKVGYESHNNLKMLATTRVMEVVKGSKQKDKTRGRWPTVPPSLPPSPSRRRESIFSSLSLQVILPLTRPRFPKQNITLYSIQIFARKYLNKTLFYYPFSISILNSVVPRGSIDRSLLTQRSMRIYILSRSGISARMCADISLYALRPEFFKRIARSCETLTLVTIRFLRCKAVHLDSIEKSAPMKYAWDKLSYLSDHYAPSFFRSIIFSNYWTQL